MKAFEDMSIFQGWMQFFDNNGREYRVEKKGNGFYTLYERAGEAFIIIGSVYLRGKATCEGVLNKFLYKSWG